MRSEPAQISVWTERRVSISTRLQPGVYGRPRFGTRFNGFWIAFRTDPEAVGTAFPIGPQPSPGFSRVLMSGVQKLVSSAARAATDFAEACCEVGLPSTLTNMNLTSLVKLLAVVVIAGLTMIGCGKSASSIGAGNTKAFDTADAATKASWEFALSAMKSNDYAAAILTFQRLLSQPTLTPEQSRAAADTMSSVSDQMTAAAAKGDAKAKEAIDALRKSRMR